MAEQITDQVEITTKQAFVGRTSWTAGEDNGVKVAIFHPQGNVPPVMFPMDALIDGLCDLRDGASHRETLERRLDEKLDAVMESVIRDAITPTTKDKADAGEVARRVREALDRAHDILAGAT